MKKSMLSRVLCLLLFVALLINCLPLGIIASAAADAVDTEIQQPDTDTGDADEGADDGIIDYSNAVGVSSADELEAALVDGAAAIRLDSDFGLDRTFYVVKDTVIISDEAHTLTRASDFGGDIFVVGENSDGTATEGRVVLSLGKPDDSTPSLITIDGNSSSMSVDVVGTALFIRGGSRADVYANVSFVNHTKVGNERTFGDDYNLSYPIRIGGAVAIVSSKASMRIFGGEFLNNRVNDITDSSTDEGNRSTQGGVIYNYGTLDIYGGSFRGNHAGRGGVFYNYRTMNVYNAEVSENTSSNLGGAVYIPNSGSAFMYLGEENDTVDSKVVFSNNTATSNGGAIYAQHMLSVKNTEFIGNVTENGEGGAIAAGAMELSIENSLFKGNKADSGYGGAIYITGSNENEDVRELIVSDTVFEGNSSTRGGAVYSSGKARSYYSGATFTDNTSTTYAGAVYSTNASLEINGATLKNNTATSNGGAIALYTSSTAVINGIDAEGNSANLGGFVYINASSLDMFNSHIHSNEAANNGGAVYSYTDSVFNAYNTVFEKNYATGNGGAVMIYNAGTNAILHTCTLESNTAGGVGGGLYISNKSQVQLYSITANRNSAAKGGFMYETTSGTVVTLVGLNVTGNTATDGGAIIWGNTTNAKLYIDKIKYADNDYNGDWDDSYWAEAIYNLLKVYDQVGTVPEYEDYNGQIVIPPAPVSVTNVSTAAQLERALQVGYTHIRITAGFEIDRTFYIMNDTTIFAEVDCVLTRASDFGGDIFVVGENEDGDKPELEIIFSLGKRDGTDASLTIDGNSENMTVDVVGTVVFVCDGSTAELCENITVTNNTKVGNERTLGGYRVSYPLRIGGAVAIIEAGAVMNVYGGVYSNNRTNDITDADTDEGSISSHGGAFYNHGTMNIYGGTFTGNHAGRGGALYNYRTMNIYSANIIGNTSSTYGGAIYMPNSTAAYLYTGEECDILTECKVYFTNNSAESGGGAIYARNLLVIKNTVFEGNTSVSYGGAIHATTTRMTVDSSMFVSNYSQSYGGAIYLTGSNEREETRELVVLNTLFDNNSSKSRAGAVYMSGKSRAYFYDTDFTSTSSATGGVFYLNGASLEINNSTISGNTASGSGAVMAVYSSSDVLLNNLTVTDNIAASSSGVAYIKDATVSIYNSTVSGNKANDGNGGAVYANTGAVFNAYNTVFKNNSSSSNAGAVMIYNGGLDSLLHSCTFEGNTAPSGGAIYISNKSQVKLYNLYGKGNSADKGGFMYETTAGTLVTLVGLTVTGNTASVGGAVIWGNTYNADLHIDKSKYLDLDLAGSPDSSYWAEAIYNKLTVTDISAEIPKYLDYGNEAYDNMADAVDVATAEELENAINAGVKHIRIVADFELDRTYFITGDVTIFTTISHTLTRAPDFAGDIFVVGETEDGLSSLRLGNNAKLTLGNPLSTKENLLVIDGNESNMTVDVVGSVLFICESATVNLHTNLTVQNCRKVNNERTMLDRYILGIPNRIGGTLAIVESGTLNIFGGYYRNNSINEELNSTEDGRISSVGGLIFNYSNLAIYGGTFENNTGARGGVIYNYRVARILGGSFISNHATTYGGVYYAPNSSQVHLYVGSYNGSAEDVLFKENTAKGSGGVIYASTLTANVIYGKASFMGNRSLTGSGGAICMYGQLTVRDCTFEGNIAANRGGAVYASKSSLESDTRFVELTGCTFTANMATLGGALSLYSSSVDYPEGAICNVTGCTFTANSASVEVAGTSSASGGAIYADRKVSLNITDTTISDNTASTEAGGIYIAGESAVSIKNSHVNNNTAGKYGGAISVRSSYLDIVGTEISGNTAVNNGGAIYVSYQSNREINSRVTIVGSDVTNNSTDANGGAIYATRRNIEDAWNILTVYNTDFTDNSAGSSGGALYTLSQVGVYLEDVSFTGNLATTDDGGNGGAMTAYGSNVEINGAAFDNNKAANVGGAVFADSSAKLIFNNITATGNSATHGGFAYLIDGAALSIYSSTLENNSSSENGGAVYSYTDSVLNIYNSVFRNNSAAGNGGALMIYNGGASALMHDTQFIGNAAEGSGGAIYISNKSQVAMYNTAATDNSAAKGGFMYETTSGTVVTVAGLTVSGNTATSGGSIIWGNTNNARLELDKSKYTDTDADSLDDAYWSEAIYNLLTVEFKSIEVPDYAGYTHTEPEADTPVAKPVISVDHVFELGQTSSDGYISSVYDKLPVLDNSSNFMSDGTTYFENINGGTVSVDSFVYDTYATDGNVNVGLGLLVYQAMLYKQANPEENVSIAVSSYRVSIEAALNINRNSRYFGYMRNLYGRDYDEFGFVRISYLLVTAAKMGINVTVIGHIDGYPILESDPNLYEYFTGHLDTPCDPQYTEGVVGDYINFAQIYWTLNEKGGTDMMHNKMCAVSHYLDMNGVAHRNAVFSSSSNLDGITSKGYNGNWKLQTATIVSDHEDIYRVATNYMRLVSEYREQEKIYEFQDIMSTLGREQVDLILEGRADEIAPDEQIVYLGTENDDVFELYFTPFPGGTAVWDEKYNPYTKYIREMYNSEDYIIFVWNAAEYNSQFPLGQQMEDIIVNSFYNNRNVNNKFFGTMEGFDKTKLDGLTEGVDIGYISVNELPFDSVHNKDVLISYMKGGQRYYVSLLNSNNMHSGSMCYQSNFMLVIKETDCDEDSVFFTMADLSTTGIVEHSYGEERLVQPATENEHGYYYYQCEHCDKIIVDGAIHNPGGWITDCEAAVGINGISHKECTVCHTTLEVKETIIEENELDADYPSHNGVIFNTNSAIDTGVSSTPLTIEAVIQLSKDAEGRGGVIVGNYDLGRNDVINLEVFTYGRVRLYTRSHGILSECYFDVDVRSDSPVHIAVTVDGTIARIYLDGALADTKTLSGALPKISDVMLIGGDYRAYNSSYFKGMIYSVAMFSDVRTAAEIAKDMLSLPINTNGLLYSRTLSTESSENKHSMYELGDVGATFSKGSGIYLDTLSAAPATVEAIIHLPESYTARAGVILGNYDGIASDLFNLEIMENGAPRLYIKNSGTAATFVFDADVRSDAPVHIAVTVDGSLASLYMNGRLADTVDITVNMPDVTDGFRVGGDNRSDNAQYFKGTIYAVGLYGSVRNAEEISRDSVLMDSSTDDLLYLSYYGRKAEEISGEGTRFTADSSIAVDALASVPRTIEATVRVLPLEYGRVGVVVGNYDNSLAPQINLEIYHGGYVRFFCQNNMIKVDCLFTSVDIRSYSARHIAVTIDGRVASLYVDGVFVESKTLTIDLPEAYEGFKVGGDNREGNTQYFKGEIYSLYMFSDVRSSEEIYSDSVSVSKDADSLIYSADLTKEAPDRFTGNEYRPDGKTYSPSEINRIDGINTSPYTFEALISVPEHIEGRAGVIVGNYNGGNGNQINVEIYHGGKVRLFFINNGVRVDTVFNTDIRSASPVHIAITVSGTVVTLYINGEIAETAELPMLLPEITDNYVIGNDHRYVWGDSQNFKGTIYSVALFGDVRDAEEIKRDIIMVKRDADSLMYSTSFASALVNPYRQGIVHSVSDWIVDREATEYANGIMHKECQLCGTVLAIHEISNTRRDGEHIDYTDKGIDFVTETDSIRIDSLPSAVLTFEALIQLDPDYANRAGVVLGSYDGTNANGLNVEIYTNGNPRLYYKVGGVGYSYVFSADIRSDAMVHIAITIEGMTARLYVNGVLSEEVTLQKEAPVITDGYYIGNDARANGGQYFKGTIYGVMLFENVRSEQDIKEDAIMVNSTEDGLLYYAILSDEE